MSPAQLQERKPETGKQNAVPRSRAAWSSTFLWAAFSFGVFLASTVVLPVLGYSLLEQHSLDPKNTCLKVKRFLLSNENPQVIVMGSSLMSAASVFADADKYGRTWPMSPRPRAIFFYNYPKCEVLKDCMVENGWDPDTSFKNLSYPGLMISEQFKIFERLLEAGKSPRAVVLTVAPRDFYSNDVSLDVNQRPVWSLLSTAWSAGELARKQDLNAAIARLLETAKDEVRTYKEMWTDQIIFADSVIKDAVESPQITLRRWLSGELAPRLLDVFDAEETGNELRDLEYYKFRYQPANKPMFSQEAGYLTRFLELARSKGVRVFVVDMPITMQNKYLIPQEMRSLYSSTLAATCGKHGAELISPKDRYSVTDYLDSVHMNGRGGLKLTREVAKSINP